MNATAYRWTSLAALLLRAFASWDVHAADDQPLLMYDELSPAQQRRLTLLGINPLRYGR